MIDWEWIFTHVDDIILRTWQHILLTAIPLAAGSVIAIGLAIWASRRPGTYTPITAVTGLLYTIPSLAAFAVLVPITGLSLLTAYIPLTMYTLLILFRNNAAGLQSVPTDVLEAAEGMGYGRRERLLRIELPLAVPLMMAGLRLAAVSTIGLATVAAILGSSFGGLGFFITEGLNRLFPTEYLLGAVLSVLLAFVVDALFVRLEIAITPWAQMRRGTGS